MPWTMEYNADLKIISVTSSGEWTPDEDDRMLDELRRLSVAHGCISFLIDFRAAKIKFEFMSIFGRAGTYEKMHFSKDSRAALLVEKIGDDHAFYEDVCANRGFKIRVFDNYNKSIRWLAPGH